MISKHQKSGPKREQDTHTHTNTHTHIPCRAGAPGTGDAAKSPWPGATDRRPSHQALSLPARDEVGQEDTRTLLTGANSEISS
eukprot:237657-Amphidinium_carterae.1